MCITIFFLRLKYSFFGSPNMHESFLASGHVYVFFSGTCILPIYFSNSPTPSQKSNGPPLISSCHDGHNPCTDKLPVLEIEFLNKLGSVWLTVNSLKIDFNHFNNRS